MIPHWITQFWSPQWLVWLGLITVLSLAAAILMAPWLASLIPPDHFEKEHPRGFPWPKGKGPLPWIRLIARNLIGLIIGLLGVIMLFTPGQGILMLMLSSMLLDYPGKYEFQRWLIRRKGVLKGINWLREKADAEPLRLQPDT